MCKGVVKTSFPRLLIVAHVVEIQRATGTWCDKPVLTRQHEAPLGEVARCNGGILIGCDVPVIRGTEFKTVVIRGADVRIKKTTFAAIVNGKGHVWQVNKGNVEKPELGALDRADAVFEIQFEFPGFQQPLRCLSRAGCKLHTMQC